MALGLFAYLASFLRRPSERSPHGDTLLWEARNVVQISDTEVRCESPDGSVQSVSWEDLQEVLIRTTSDGPLNCDVFWVLGGSHSRCVIPQGATGEQDLLSRLMQLPRFDNDAFNQAMSSAEDQSFVCWRKSG